MNVSLHKVFILMNLKERGITVGDLCILIVALVSIFTYLKIKDSKNDQSARFNLVTLNLTYKIEFDQKLFNA